MRFALITLLLTSVTSADLSPYFDDNTFENLGYGPYPTQSFHSSPELAPRPNVIKVHPNPDPSLYTFFEPRGWTVDRPGPMIVDSDWSLIWTSSQWGNSYNHQVQRWKGQDYLTFWAGDDGIGGHGEGYMFMLDSSYKTVRTFAAKNGYMADQHGFGITDQGTLLFTIYETRKANLEPIGKPGRCYIWDCLFQEVDIETGKLLFEWRASDHIDFRASFDGQGGTSYWDPWDWFHLNSVDKDDLGNYLLSARYTQALHYISGSDGSVLWELGGKRSSFQDLSDGHATDFCYQHDARWQANQTKISLFDNHSENHHPDLGPTRGKLIGVDLDLMTVELLVEYHNPQNLTCVSQGAMQILDNGDVFVGYGYCGAFTQFSQNGTVLEDVHIGPQEQFTDGNIQSYRARKHQWKGYPSTAPDIAIDKMSAYVSWNGATEVKNWELQHAERGLWATEDDWEPLDRFDRTGFETRLDFDEQALRRYVRVMAYDAEGECLGTSVAVDWRFARTRLAQRFKLQDITSCVAFFAALGLILYVLVRILRHAIRRALQRVFHSDYTAVSQQSFDTEHGYAKES